MTEAGAGLPARRAAYELLRGVTVKQRPLDELLADTEILATLEPRDRAFARNLAATALRRMGQADALIDAFLEKPLPAQGAGVRDILRLGIVQLLFLETPAHAAVDQSVTLTGQVRLGKYKALVNAILRRAARDGRRLAGAQDAPRLNTPDWLWHSWETAYGAEAARGIAEAHLSEAPLDISVKADPEIWAARLEAAVLPTGTLRRAAGGNVTGLSGFDEGAWWVQDAAAALPVRLLGQLKGRRVIDLCAAPGGKTAQLANAGAQVIAVDRSAARLKRLSENLSRLGLAAETVAADGTLWRPEKKADAVLLDAPCSATGTIRRHPDIARLKTPQDVARLAALQDRLLEAAVGMLRPGGTLVYCTCSLQPEEGEARLSALLKSGAPVETDPIAAREIGGESAFVTGEGWVRTLPSHWPESGGLDGFFIARLRRT